MDFRSLKSFQEPVDHSVNKMPHTCRYLSAEFRIPLKE